MVDTGVTAVVLLTSENLWTTLRLLEGGMCVYAELL